ncbi:MAG: dihydroxy-acid dehydratase, partial [Planctomycetota bacterium]|nr:dihydroxy-acid dehydratase [Planctomycetota bacterium]
CIGHVGPEALAGGPIGKLREGDLIEIEVDRNNLTGKINFIGCDGQQFSPDVGTEILAEREPVGGLAPDPLLPADTKLWAILQQIGGGTWGGCVYDVDEIERVINAGVNTLQASRIMS